jgi:hypothetical protein
VSLFVLTILLKYKSLQQAKFIVQVLCMSFLRLIVIEELCTFFNDVSECAVSYFVNGGVVKMCTDFITTSK